MKKIMLVCSNSNYSYIEFAKEQLEILGFEVIFPNEYEKKENNDLKDLDENEYKKHISDMFKLTKSKIASSNAILVLNYDEIENNEIYENHIDSLTFLNMYEAFMIGKEIYLMNPILDSSISEELTNFNGKVINGDFTEINKNIIHREYNTNVSITNADIDWMKIKSACMTTISKQASKTPNDEWKRKLLLSEHSPIRRGNISWKWNTIPYAISTHFARHHEGCEKYIGTERDDRTNISRESRSQMNYVPMEMDANIQALINISNKRLCSCADPTTRMYWSAVVECLKDIDYNVYWACVPSCVYRGGCPEGFSNCGFYSKLMKYAEPEEYYVLSKRYDRYNKYRNNKKTN